MSIAIQRLITNRVTNRKIGLDSHTETNKSLSFSPYTINEETVARHYICKIYIQRTTQIICRYLKTH